MNLFAQRGDADKDFQRDWCVGGGMATQFPKSVCMICSRRMTHSSNVSGTSAF